MKKLALDPGSLQVQSFEATPELRMHPEVPVAEQGRTPLCDPLTVRRCDWAE